MSAPDLERLRRLVAPLFYPGEQDAPLFVEDLGDAGTIVGGVHTRWPDADEASLDGFFFAPSRGGFAAAFPENVAGFAALRAALADELGLLTAFVAGDTHLVAGQAASGRVVAIVTTVIAT